MRQYLAERNCKTAAYGSSVQIKVVREKMDRLLSTWETPERKQNVNRVSRNEIEQSVKSKLDFCGFVVLVY